MGHFRLCAMMLVEEIIKTLCIQTPIIIQDMCILLCDHRSLCMAGVTLNGFNITAVQFEFVCNTGVSEAMKDHFGEIVFLNQPLQCGDIGIFVYDDCGYLKKYDEHTPDKSQEEFLTDSYGVVHNQPVLVSLNTKYSPILISPEQRFEIVGKVLN